MMDVNGQIQALTDWVGPRRNNLQLVVKRKAFVSIVVPSHFID
jgi:hypothetical protein